MKTAEPQSKAFPTPICSEHKAAIVILITVTLHAILFFFPANLLPIAVGIAGALFTLTLLLREPMAVHLTLLTFLITIGVVILPWSLFFVISLAIYAAVVVATPSWRSWRRYWCCNGNNLWTNAGFN